MAAEYIFEPSPEAVLNRVLYGFTEVQVLQALYESIASEHSARMVAMRNATDAAGELIDDLTLTYNKARQEGITNELMDIIGGSAGAGDGVNRRVLRGGLHGRTNGRYRPECNRTGSRLCLFPKGSCRNL